MSRRKNDMQRWEVTGCIHRISFAVTVMGNKAGRLKVGSTQQILENQLFNLV